MNKNKFNKLLNDVIEQGILTEYEPQFLEMSLNFKFNNWLQKNKGWDGNPDSWSELTTELNFAEFLRSEALFVNESLQGCIELFELRYEQELVLYREERKLRGEGTGIEDELSCRLRCLKNEERKNNQFFSDQYPNGSAKKFNPELRFPFVWDERKKFGKWLINEIDTTKIKSQLAEINTENIKLEAISKTVNFFKANHNIEPDQNKLLNALNLENKYIDTAILDLTAQIKIGNIGKHIDILRDYYAANIQELQDINLNKSNYVSNSKPENLIGDYCIYSFYKLFNEAQIHLLKKLQSEKPERNLKQDLLPPQAETTKGKEDFDKVLSEIKELENKFWKGLPMDKVIEHFEVMTKRVNKSGNVFLTNEQLISFLKKGFLNDTTQPKQKIQCSNGEKGFVIKRFYDFFDLAVSKYCYPQQKRNFINLFTDCFDNWEQSTIEPFFKPNKTKDNW